jgi:pimeloyl-ACP methyl ester carboxylesterase
MATQPEAYSNLDIIRAVQGSDFPVSKKVVLAGQSQGAGAAIATAGYWPAYAPELDIRGVVATGVPYFSPEAVRALRHARPRDAVDPKLGYNFLVLSLLEYVDPTFDAAQHLKPNALPLAREVASECNRDIRKKISQLGLTYNDVFETSREMSIEAAYAYMGFPTLTLAAPLFIGTGLADVDTPPRMQFQLMKAACSAGTQVSAHTYRSLDHLSVLNHSLKDSVPFAKNAFDGNALPGNCTALPF